MITMTSQQDDRRVYEIAGNDEYVVVAVDDPTPFGGADYRWMLVDVDSATAPSYAAALAMPVWERPRSLTPRAWGATRDDLWANAALAGYVLSAEDQAAAAAGDAFAARHTSDIPDTLGRAEYEARCQAAGIAPRGDAECGAYGIQYGAFDASNDRDGSRRVAQALAIRRHLAIPTAADATITRRTTPVSPVGFAPADTTDAAVGSSADKTDGSCAWDACAGAGWHNPGAGVVLCATHWDAY